MNELIQFGAVSESHCHVQGISLFTSMFGDISEDPLRGIKSLHKLHPAVVILQEKIRNSISGRQAYNAYLGKHTVGKGEGSIADGMSLPSPNSVKNVGISPSGWYKKAPVPLVYDGVVINYIQTLQKIFPGVTSIKLVSKNCITMYVTVSFDQKAISPGI